MVFYIFVPNFDDDKFQHQDCSQNVYCDALPDQPSNMPNPRGQGFIVNAYVDIYHSGDTVTRGSRTGFYIYCNNALAYWISKKQEYIETSYFGSEFLAMKACTEYIRGLNLNLQMIGIQCDCPTFIYGDNQYILANTTMPHLMIKKKSNSILYHFVRAGTARD